MELDGAEDNLGLDSVFRIILIELLTAMLFIILDICD